MENNLFYGNAGSATFAINLVCFKRTISIEPRVGRKQSPESSLIMGVLKQNFIFPEDGSEEVVISAISWCSESGKDKIKIPKNYRRVEIIWVGGFL